MIYGIIFFMIGDRATAFVYKDNKVLMIFRHKNDNEYYVLPGGHVEEGETLAYATTRELLEETSIKADFDKKLFSLIDINGRTHHICLCKYISGVPKLANDSVEVGRASEKNIYNPMWVDVKEIKNLTIWPEQTKDFLIKYFK